MLYEPKEIPKSHQAICRFINDRRGKDNDTIILSGESDFSAFLGITQDGHAVYDFDKMVKNLTASRNISEAEADDEISYNTCDAYVGKMTPYIVNRTDDTISSYMESVDDADMLTYIPDCDNACVGFADVSGKISCIYDKTLLPTVILNCKYLQQGLIIDPFVCIPSKKKHKKKAKGKKPIRQSR